MLYDFDVPAIGSDKPDPTRKLVGRPDPAIGGDVHAWSPVPVVRRRPKVSILPMVGVGFLGACIGFMAAMGIASAVPYETQNSIPFFVPLVLLGCPALLSFLGVTAVRSFASADLDPKITVYLGAEGMQVNELGTTGLRTNVVTFRDHALFYERFVKTINGVSLGPRTRMQFVAASSGGDTTTVSSMVHTSVSDAVRSYHRARATSEQTFELFRPAEDVGDMGAGHPTGRIVLGPDGVSLGPGETSARYAELRCAYDAQPAVLTLGFPSGPVLVRLGTVANGPVLIAALAARGLLPSDALVA
jgi:hypothetical protein